MEFADQALIKDDDDYHRRFNNIGIIGAGTFGTALAQVLSCRASIVGLYTNSPDVVYSVNERHMNYKFLPDLNLNKNINCFYHFDQIFSHDILFICVPSIQFVNSCLELKKYIIKQIPIVICTKGLNPMDYTLLDSTVRKILDTQDIGILAGPSFAQEIGYDHPTFVSIGSDNINLATTIALELSTDHFIIKPIRDTVGLQLFGALKNVVAIGAGVINSMKYGDGLQSCFINASANEIIRLVRSMSGSSGIILELGAFADLCMTCYTHKSKNFLLGVKIAKSILYTPLCEENVDFISEGATTARSIPALEKQHNIMLPCLSLVYKILYTAYDKNNLLPDLMHSIHLSI